jgi:hypothetical protein
MSAPSGCSPQARSRAKGSTAGCLFWLLQVPARLLRPTWMDRGFDPASRGTVAGLCRCDNSAQRVFNTPPDEVGGHFSLF